jgi:hypothetical protein
MLDTKITQGSYWGGAQIPYWVYMILVILPFTGFGLDHLALRSPITAILKFLSIIPLFGFWYFYDIAQVTGESELIQKYGLALPFYGPVGIGAGMFSGTNGIKEAPRETPKPWLFIFYALTTLVFVAFPVNKFIIGDYTYGFVQLWSLLFILPAIIIGCYDIYNLIFNTKGILEDGPARFPVIPAFIIGKNFDETVLGPKKNGVGKSQSFGLVGKIAEIVAVEGTKRAVDSVIEPVKAVGSVVEGAAAVASSAEEAALATTESITDGARATESLFNLVSTLPDALNKVVTDLPDKLAKQALTKAGLPQSGGAIHSSSSISTTTIALLLSVGVMAFSGYVFYMYKNTYRKPEKSDVPPRNPRAVRGTSEARE